MSRTTTQEAIFLKHSGTFVWVSISNIDSVSQTPFAACLKFDNIPEDPKAPRAEPSPTPRDPLVPLKPRELLGGGAALVWEKSELLWELGATEPEP